MTFRMSPKEIDSFFKKEKINGSRHQINSGSKAIYYVKAGKPDGALVLFVHGSPGSLSAFIHFLADSTLNQQSLLIAADRPGFGHSNFGKAEPSLKKQASALIPIVQTHSANRPVVLIGHSLGGPLIARMALDYPGLVDGLILIAPSIDPQLEPNESWWRAPFTTPFLRWVLPRSLRASNEEIYRLKPQLEAMLPEWKNITCPVIIIQGEKDSLVPPGNVDFAEAKLVNARVKTVRKADMNHFVPWTNPELIRNAIIELVSHPSDLLSGH
ncbi:alpha/beta hydrolase [Oscillatoria amoena NRMC-F 0135]|nr:alpha/beta hydrolase [Oscillatoria amoena NRMC-F 0135]